MPPFDEPRSGHFLSHVREQFAILFLHLGEQTAKLAQIARVFALTAPGDAVKLSLQGKGRSRRKRSRATLLSTSSGRPDVGQEETRCAASRGPGRDGMARVEPAREGDITGTEDLLIDGSIERLIHLDERKLTVGTTVKLTADINGRDVVV